MEHFINGKKIKEQRLQREWTKLELGKGLNLTKKDITGFEEIVAILTTEQLKDVCILI